MTKSTQSRFEARPYPFAFLDEGSKREIRRKTLKAIAIPGYQVPFASRELPIGRGWGTGGLQLTMSLIGPNDRLKVIDQGNDDSVNAVNIRKLAEHTSGIAATFDTTSATVIQSRHRIPEERLAAGQVLVMQVPQPEPLRKVEKHERITSRMHAERDYGAMWLTLYESVVQWGTITTGAGYPVMVEDRYLMSTSPIPRWDVEKLHDADHLTLFGAGTEKKIFAIPPYTRIEPLQFEDVPFEKERFEGAVCRHCGSRNTFMDEIGGPNGERLYQCSDTAYCNKQSDLQQKRGK